MNDNNIIFNKTYSDEPSSEINRTLIKDLSFTY